MEVPKGIKSRHRHRYLYQHNEGKIIQKSFEPQTLLFPNPAIDNLILAMAEMSKPSEAFIKAFISSIEASVKSVCRAVEPFYPLVCREDYLKKRHRRHPSSSKKWREYYIKLGKRYEVIPHGGYTNRNYYEGIPAGKYPTPAALARKDLEEMGSAFFEGFKYGMSRVS